MSDATIEARNAGGAGWYQLLDTIRDEVLASTFGLSDQTTHSDGS